MSRRPLRVGRPFAVIAAVLVLVLSACGSSEDDAGAAAPPTTEAPKPLTAAQLKKAVNGHVKKIERADRRLSSCEASVAGYGFNNCWEQTSRTFNRAKELVADLKQEGPPATYVTLLAEAERFVSVQPEVRQGCRTRNDQTCDTALMSYRTELQDLLWAAP